MSETLNWEERLEQVDFNSDWKNDNNDIIAKELVRQNLRQLEEELRQWDITQESFDNYVESIIPFLTRVDTEISDIAKKLKESREVILSRSKTEIVLIVQEELTWYIDEILKEKDPTRRKELVNKFHSAILYAQKSWANLREMFLIMPLKMLDIMNFKNWSWSQEWEDAKTKWEIKKVNSSFDWSFSYDYISRNINNWSSDGIKDYTTYLENYSRASDENLTDDSLNNWVAGESENTQINWEWNLWNNPIFTNLPYPRPKPMRISHVRSTWERVHENGSPLNMISKKLKDWIIEDLKLEWVDVSTFTDDDAVRLLHKYNNEDLLKKWKIPPKNSWALIFAMQYTLVREWYEMVIDGIYWDTTKNAVKEFQKSTNWLLKVDGVPWTLTATELIRSYEWWTNV